MFKVIWNKRMESVLAVDSEDDIDAALDTMHPYNEHEIISIEEIE